MTVSDTNFHKAVRCADIDAEMAAFSEEGYRLVNAHPISNHMGLWGYDLFFVKADANRP